jgi:hypothetical protein
VDKSLWYEDITEEEMKASARNPLKLHLAVAWEEVGLPCPPPVSVELGGAGLNAQPKTKQEGDPS